jgi:putative lipoprotein
VTIKRTFLAALVATTFLGGCESTGSDRDQAADLVGTSWVAKEIGGRGVIDGTSSTLDFGEPGQVFGKGGCNRFFGGVTIKGEAIEFGQMGSTMMACPTPMMDQERAYLDALGNAKRFESKDGLLLIFGDGPDPIIRFVNGEAAPK